MLKLNRRRAITIAAGGVLSPFAAPYIANANTTSPVVIVMPFAAGGPIDNIMRVIAKGMSNKLGQPVLIDSKPGGNGIVGALQVVQGKKDGTILFAGGTGTLSLNFMLRKNLQFSRSDLASVAMLFSGPLGFTVPAKMPVTNVKEFVEYARTTSKPLFYATVGIGSVTHLYGIIMSQMMGFKMTDVPYRNNAQTIMALLSGDGDMIFAAPTAVMEHVKAGTLKLLAVSSANRIKSLPDTPTFAESGYPDMTGSFWFGLQAPAGTPPSLISRLNEAVNSSLQQPEVSELLVNEHFEVESGPPALHDEQMKKDIAFWDPVIKERNIVLE